MHLSFKLPWAGPARCIGGVNDIDEAREAPKTSLPDGGSSGRKDEGEASPGMRMPSERKMRRFAGLKMVDFEGERGRLASLAIMGVFMEELAPLDRKCASDRSCKGPGWDITTKECFALKRSN